MQHPAPKNSSLRSEFFDPPQGRVGNIPLAIFPGQPCAARIEVSIRRFVGVAAESVKTEQSGFDLRPSYWSARLLPQGAGDGKGPRLETERDAANGSKAGRHAFPP